VSISSISSIGSIAARPLRRVRDLQLLAVLRSFDEALADLDDDADTTFDRRRLAA
jgi:hypothetical protein